MPTPRRLALALPFALALGACAEDAPPAAPLGSIIEPGKADNFLSQSAREYWVEGTTAITLDASWASKSESQRLAEVKRLVPYKQVVIGWFLNRYIVDKEEKDPDAKYGGFKSLTKNGSYEDLNLTKVSDLQWTFDFRQEIGGQTDLLSDIPDAKPQGDGTWLFDLVVGRVSNEEMQRLETDNEWYRASPWGAFTPDSVSADRKETLRLKIRPQPDEDDAWIELDRLMADKKLSVGVHFGWDYHSAYHEKHSKDVYTWLTTKKAFKSPVAKWEDLRHDAGPLKGKVTYRGKSVDVEVSLFWGRKGDATDPDTGAGGKQLEKDMLTSLASREVIIFSGHSGPFYGFALANWRMTSEGDLDDSELMKVPLLKGQYQLIVAEGCDTYAIGQAFALNPDKPGLKDLDVITTTSFSNAASSGTLTDVLATLLGPIGSATTGPKLYSELLDELDSNSYWFNSMYGVHGLDDNPRVHPWADLTKSCKTCSKAADCGDGMQCVKMKDGKGACAALCTASIGCGTGYSCRNVSVDRYISAQVCAPESLQCGVAAPVAGKVLINEVMPNPAADYNADGKLDKTQDEYVEIVNAGNANLDLSGWSLADGYGTRHAFATGSVIPPGGALVVFGGGTPKLVAGTTLVQVASTKRLGLNDDGDAVKLADKDGHIAARTEWKQSLGTGMSWGRGKDLDANASFASQSPSCGMRQDGTNF
jgi:hypothetical protein